MIEEIKGVYQPDVPLARQQKKRFTIPVSNPERRRVRYRLMRIVNGNDDVQDDLKDRIEVQLKKLSLTWNGFTKTWDVARHDPYRVVRL